MSLKIISLVIPASFLLSVSLVVMVLIYKTALFPYMDEIFHILQAQQYCKGNFSYWCSNITTPPGLYLFSVALLNPIASAIGETSSCTVLQLRSINLFFAVGNFYLLFAILNHLNASSKNFRWWHCGLTAFTLATFPTLYFFTFLYYTDAGSTFFVLFCYLLTLKRSYFLSAIMGAISLTFRQTNIIWIVFCALLTSNDVLVKYEGRELKNYDKNNWKYIKVTLIAWLSLLLNRRSNSYSELVGDMVTRGGGYALGIFGFILFIIWNGGIVLGDKTSHQATVHLPQLFYFALFSVLFASGHTLNKRHVNRFLLLMKSKLLLMLSLAFISIVVVYFNTQFHIYNLSDNRHFNFYFYSKLIRRHPLVKFLLIPLYMFCSYVMFDMLKQSRGILWTIEYGLCLTANLVFQSLLEFRYFIIGYLLFRLNLPLAEGKLSKTFIELTVYLLINIFSIYLFVMKPFVRPGDDVLSRFMW